MLNMLRIKYFPILTCEGSVLKMGGLQFKLLFVSIATIKQKQNKTIF